MDRKDLMVRTVPKVLVDLKDLVDSRDRPGCSDQPVRMARVDLLDQAAQLE